MRCTPISGKRGSFRSGDVSFDSGRFVIRSEKDSRIVLTQIHDETDRDDCIPIIDVDSFDRRFINSDLVKDLRLRGRNLWLISYIRTIDDVIDAMCGSFEILCVPTHTVDGMDVLSDALEISDRIIPTVFVDKSGVPLFERSLDRIVKDVRNLGYPGYALLDIDHMELTHHGQMNNPDIVSDSSFTML